ncbi:probable disease resistance RPP8-like protein 2 [Oryza sativa Japonica Group]|uniref:Os04g0112100 protein n=2 Tax=Oryza sativa subsp. japonica TaxID=39947 RepID=Q7XQC4_ORYSJ|nr:putative disease resistance protein RGA4 [Oryza sativa Japonica Group]XP_015633768.1 putative disease resistance protein RGA4 [Oryza sativa Japonica Group]EAZ29475.1 hypothetical protein OsJ_13550 [Oryza sativa Japonica Group]CAE03195.2 OSJNBb0060M15.7 [Oryza sativa Japonica Group]BAF13949.2 Os04g0112100 [Oryza sativa Japonica Group]BAH01405.1 unnamed protein product [Oryza sativa Japonica Group]BAS87582.1 Os04g0112100 [Oryza sativa Japonica Group]|eukprot:NP_001052035.2 Os04g0112100 [Oryza sativa Japonica Group]
MPIGAISTVGPAISPGIKIAEIAESFVARKYRRLRDYRKDVAQLVGEVGKIAVAVDTVEEQEQFMSDRRIVGQLSELMDAIHEAEDILDAVDYRDSIWARKHKVRQVIHSIVEQAKRIVGIDGALNRLDKSMNDLPRMQQNQRDLVQLSNFRSSQGGGDGGASASRPRSATGLLPDGKLYGYKEEYDRLVSALLYDPPRRPGGNGNGGGQVVAVVGDGGVGKTALAQHALRHVDVQARFDHVIWASVPHKYRNKDLLAEIWMSGPGATATAATHRCADQMSFGALQAEFVRLVSLSSQRYLLVLDDVCNDESDDDDHQRSRKEWEDVLAPFKQGERGNT